MENKNNTPLSEGEWDWEKNLAPKIYLNDPTLRAQAPVIAPFLREYWEELKPHIRSLLAHQKAELEKRDSPIGVTQWLNWGHKYGYDKYFKDKWSDEIREIYIEKEKAAKAEGAASVIAGVRILIEKTYTGCACGLHGFIVLPDCDDENHGNRCARCILATLDKNEDHD